MPYKDVAAKRLCQLNWLRKRREIWLAANGPCVGCGSNSALQVDHIDHTQKVSHRIWSWSDARRKAELAKCQVLCTPCHRVKSAPHQRATSKRQIAKFKRRPNGQLLPMDASHA